MTDTTDIPLVRSDAEPLPWHRAAAAVARCIAVSFVMLMRGRVYQPQRHVGEVVTFADGSAARVYRETVIPVARVDRPAALVVAFRLRGVRGRGHALFRAESVLNTPLFAGFPGLVSKLWLAHDQRGRYRGVYQWDGADRAES